MDRALKVGFVFFLALVAVRRLVGWKLAAPEARGSIVAEARYAANTYVPLGFSGW